VVPNWFPKPRWKTYAAQSGYVYQYIFEGLRGDHEYNFRAVSGPQIEMTLRVILDPQVLDAWAAANRPLTATECYGIAKMAVMRAMDEQTEPGGQPASIQPDSSEVASICAELRL
jgi:hypothetical protein